MKILFYILPIFILCSCKQHKNIKEDNSRPNVILIMTDDQGYGDLGFTGNTSIQTPNLDALKGESAFLTNFYVSPVCSPTRASLMTGKFSLRTGVYDTFNGGSLMSTEEVTMAEIFKNAGYKTSMYGKWHLGGSYPFRPSDQGFDKSLIHHGGGIGQASDPMNYAAADSSYFNPILFKNNKAIQSQGYCSDVFTDGAIQFIEENSKAPFFTYLSFNAPHSPLQVPKEWYNMYKDLTFEDGGTKTNGLVHPQMNDREKEDARKVYGMVSNIDYNIGRVIKKLKDKNILENTIIVFLSDNGPKSVRYNAGLRGLKSSTYNGGVKSPCIIRHPKLIPQGKKINTVTAHIDLLPTIADLCGIDLDAGLNIDGKSIVPLFSDQKKEIFEDRYIYEQWDRMFPERYKNMSVRKGKYKLLSHANYEATIQDFELYDTDADPSESNNIVAENLELAKQLKEELDNWFDREVVENGNPKRVYLGLNPDKEDTLVLTRNEMKGTPGIGSNDFQYGYWDVDVQKAGHYDINFYFKTKATKSGSLYAKQHPLQYSKSNSDIDANMLQLKNVYLKEGKGPLEIFYKTSWNEIMIPFYVKIFEENSNR